MPNDPEIPEVDLSKEVLFAEAEIRALLNWKRVG